MEPNLISDTRQKMERALEVLRGDLATIRTGRATPSMIEHIVVPAYGGTQKLKLMELATITISDTQTLVVAPFDPSIIFEIQKGILEANVGLTPIVSEGVIRISIPPLSQERRQELIKVMHQKLEGGKILVRQTRQEANSEVKKEFSNKTISEDELARAEKEIQKATDNIMLEIENLGKRKAEELSQV